MQPLALRLVSHLDSNIYHLFVQDAYESYSHHDHVYLLLLLAFAAKATVTRWVVEGIMFTMP